MKNYTITINGNVYAVTVEEGNGEGVATASAPKAAAPAAAPAAAAAPAGNQGAVQLKAPMGGKVLAIKAPVGTAVKKGQPVITFEAMKMENDLVAMQDGVVASINVSVNDKFETGTVLATLK